MEMSMVTTVVFLILCLHYYTSIIAEAIVKLPRNETIPGLIFFGDSIVDTGSNNGLHTVAKSNFLPYGKDFQGGKPTGRFSNGKVPTDFIAEELGIKGSIPPYCSHSFQPDGDDHFTGINFASGGSGYDPLSAKIQSVIPLSVQLNQFKEYLEKLKAKFGEERTNFILSKSIFIVVASSNDIANSYYATGIRKLQYDVSSYSDFLSQLASSFIKEIYGLGARRIGVFGAPPVGCLPFMRTLFGGIERTCPQEINLTSKLFNANLMTKMDHLNQNLHQAKVVYIDVYDPLLQIIENPANYGFEVVDRGCCGTGTIEVSILCNRLQPICRDDSKSVFWDSFHPTEKTYQILVNKIINRYINNFF